MRIMILTPWPLVRFLHGGQLRTSAIVEAYEEAGHAVLVRAYYDPTTTDAVDVGAEDYPVPHTIARHYDDADLGSDFRFSRALPATPEILDAYVERARAFAPDILQFEEPYLWPLARAIRDRLGGISLLYSSHNFETVAKAELRRAGAPVTERTLADVAATEAAICREADAIVAVSLEDEASFRALGAHHVVTAPNGATRRAATPDSQRAVRAYLGSEPFALFVSSGHPPNLLGLVETVGEAVGISLDRGTLLVCGGVAQLLRDHLAFTEHDHIFGRARLLGVTSLPVLDALYAGARVIVLPKTCGGGSNLKTAEALLSGRPIVATAQAFTGYSPHRDAPGVHIAADGADLWRTVRDLLDAPINPPHIIRGDEGLLWPACLAPLVAFAERLHERGSAP